MPECEYLRKAQAVASAFKLKVSDMKKISFNTFMHIPSKEIFRTYSFKEYDALDANFKASRELKTKFELLILKG